MLNLVREGEEDYIEAIRYGRRLKIFENFLLQLLPCSDCRKYLLDYLKFRKLCKACYVRIEHPKCCIFNSSNSTPGGIQHQENLS